MTPLKSVPPVTESIRPANPGIERLFKKYELGSAATLEQIKPVAIKLLDQPQTGLEAAELILNRRVSVDDPVVREIFKQTMGLPEAMSQQRLDLLLILRDTELVSHNPETHQSSLIEK